MKVINVKSKFDKFNDQWSPRIIGQLNNQHVLLAKIEGEFIWHDHKDEDELFYVVKGSFVMEYRDRKETLNEGDMVIVPRGVEHRPCAQEECWVMLFEPISTKHTGEVQDDRTVSQYEEI